MLLTQDRVRELFDYHEDGYLIRKARRMSKFPAGTIAGSAKPDGRSCVKIDKKMYWVHRLIFLWHWGYLPPVVDHDDRDPSNNRIGNLRAADKSKNGCNRGKTVKNTSGFKGVTWNRRDKKWYAQIRVGRKKVYIGLYSTPEEAYEAYCAAGKKLHGEFFCAD